jgi:8-oxo-dGTP pyrophosphatase MutT (NUDIX family)
MKITDRKTAYEGSFFRIVDKHVITANGNMGVWETVERTNVDGRGAVVIIPVTKDDELILEKNWRAPIETFVIQFPAGLTDIPGEDEVETARRELLEETGYLAKELIPVMAVPLTPAMAPTSAMHYYAPDVEYTGLPTGKDIEEIEVVKVKLDRVADYLLNLPPGVELDLRVPGILWVMQQRKLI